VFTLHLECESTEELFGTLRKLLEGEPKTTVAYDVPAVSLGERTTAEADAASDVAIEAEVTPLSVVESEKPRLRRARPKKEAPVLSAPSETFENFPTATPTVPAPTPSTTKAEFKVARFSDLTPDQYPAFETRLIALGAAS
jgi:hypothetical protein